MDKRFQEQDERLDDRFQKQEDRLNNHLNHELATFFGQVTLAGNRVGLRPLHVQVVCFAVRMEGAAMARVSKQYRLGLEQPSLDFVDVNVSGDVPVFLDPRAIRRIPSDWGEQCLVMLRTFFHCVLYAIRTDDKKRVRQLLVNLSEPNETRLGFSRGRPRGRGLGRHRGTDIADALSGSKAAQTGLLEDLEDTILMVPGIGHDIVSDITTNVLRGPLIGYTQHQCLAHDIPLVEVDSGPVWNPAQEEWERDFIDLPYAGGRKLLFVPKALVRFKLDFSQEEYYRDFLVPILQEEELSDPRSRLVRTLKDGRRIVTKKAIRERYGDNKLAIVDLTDMHREALSNYRQVRKANISRPLDHQEIALAIGGDSPAWDELLDAITSIRPGQAEASKYHHAVEALLTTLLYPALTMPRIEYPIHQGRKRIDITYTNTGVHGFFWWLATHQIPSRSIFVECKNYGKEMQNPELDQLAGRFSPLRGQVGILVCRSLRDKDLFLTRCRDTALDHRGYIIALDDDDLRRLVEEAKTEKSGPTSFSGLFKQRFDALVT